MPSLRVEKPHPTGSVKTPGSVHFDNQEEDLAPGKAQRLATERAAQQLASEQATEQVAQ